MKTKIKLLFIPIIIGIIALNENFAFAQLHCNSTFTVTAGPNVSVPCCCACVTIGGSPTASCDGSACSGCTYSWAPATRLSCTTCANPCANPTVTTTYTVTVNFPASCCCSTPGTVICGQAGNDCNRSNKTSTVIVSNPLIGGVPTCTSCCRIGIFTKNQQEINTGNYILYPNPSGGIFTISTEEQKSNVSMDVFDMQGNNVWSRDNIPDKTVAIDISNVAKGFYFIQVKEQDNVTYVKKIVIQ